MPEQTQSSAAISAPRSRSQKQTHASVHKLLNPAGVKVDCPNRPALRQTCGEDYIWRIYCCAANPPVHYSKFFTGVRRSLAPQNGLLNKFLVEELLSHVLLFKIKNGAGNTCQTGFVMLLCRQNRHVLEALCFLILLSKNTMKVD